MDITTENLMEKIVALAKRRGFIFPGSEIYGGLAGTWDYGPLGCELKNIIRWEWKKRFIYSRKDVFLIESGILMNAKVWEAAGHVKSFVDPMVDCRKCKSRFHADKIDVKKKCPECGAKDFTEARPFNMMFKTFVGPLEDSAAETYLRPETAQGMFVNFKNVLDTMHQKLPFGIAQVGRAFRNEITPGNFIFRIREFEQMEIEWFCRESEWKSWFEYWQEQMEEWIKFLGIAKDKIHLREVSGDERAHYSKRTIDIDYDFPFGREELYGLAYRTDFDLKKHSEESGVDLSYYEEEAKERFIPHVIEPTFGVERTVLALLVEHYLEDGDRMVLKLPTRLAPVKVAVFPLLANKKDLVDKARDIYEMLHKDLGSQGMLVMLDDRGNIGKRYYAQDEIGTPWCVTVDYQSLEDGTVTVRDRDTTKQERVVVKELVTYFTSRLHV